MPRQLDYPWFGVVSGTELEQGDLLLNCPRFLLRPVSLESAKVASDRESVNAVVLTQSCDLAIRPDGDCEVADVLLCPYFQKREFSDHPLFRKDAAWEEARKGRRPYFHVLNECKLPGHEQDFALVDFHDLFTLPVALVRDVAVRGGDRLRLLPPYREHLSQAFARLFMRVGLPADLPPFVRKK